MTIREIYTSDFHEQYEIRVDGHVMLLHCNRLPDPTLRTMEVTLFVDGTQWRRRAPYQPADDGDALFTPRYLANEWVREQMPYQHIWEKA